MYTLLTYFCSMSMDDRLFLTLAAAICGGSDKWRASSPQRAQEPHGDQAKRHEQDRLAAFSRDREVGRQRESKGYRQTNPRGVGHRDEDSRVMSAAILLSDRPLTRCLEASRTPRLSLHDTQRAHDASHNDLHERASSCVRDHSEPKSAPPQKFLKVLRQNLEDAWRPERKNDEQLPPSPSTLSISEKAALLDEVAAEHEQQRSACLSMAQDRHGEIDKIVTRSYRDAPSIAAPRALSVTSFSRRKGPEVRATETEAAAAANSELAAAAVDASASSVGHAAFPKQSTRACDWQCGFKARTYKQVASHEASCHLKIDHARLSASTVLDASQFLNTSGCESGTDLNSDARSAVKAVSDGSPPSPNSKKCSVPRARDHIEILFEPQECSTRPADWKHRQTSDSSRDKYGRTDKYDVYLHNAASPAAKSSGEVFSPKKSLKKIGRFITSLLVKRPCEAALPDRETDFRTEAQQGAITRVLEYNGTRRYGDDIAVMHTSLTSRNVDSQGRHDRSRTHTNADGGVGYVRDGTIHREAV
jgi:hypothetical protein